MKPKGKKKCGSQRDEMAESKDLELTSSQKTPKSQLTAEQSSTKKRLALGFPGGPVVKNLPCNAGDTGLIPGQERYHMP